MKRYALAAILVATVIGGLAVNCVDSKPEKPDIVIPESGECSYGEAATNYADIYEPGTANVVRREFYCDKCYAEKYWK